jgi:hypothetical protein
MNEKMTGSEPGFRPAHIPAFVLYLLIPVEMVGVCVFIVYAIFHWTAFVGQSAALFSWLAWFAGLMLYTGQAWLAVKVVRSGIEALLVLARGVADVHGKFVENRIARARRELLHTDTNYVVYLDRGKVTVQPVIQERYTYSIRQAREDSEESEAGDTTVLPAPRVQTFRELLQEGVIQSAISQGKMLLGYASGGTLRFGSWLDLYSCAVGGVSGSGKTTTVRFLLFQAILAGARLLMVDPHRGEPEESLAAQFQVFRNAHLYEPCDDNPSAILKRVRWLDKELKRRKATGDKLPFIIFVIDEFNAVMRVQQVRDEMSPLLVFIAQEGRKFGIFAMLIGQRWSHQDIGGADIRTSLASALAHRFTDEEQAKKLVGSRNAARCLELQQGHYLFRDTQGALTEMVTPFTVESDGAYIQRLLDHEENAGNQPERSYETSQKGARNQYAEIATPPPDISTRNLLESGVKAGTKAVYTEELEGQDAALIARMQQVLKMQAEGKQKAEIIRTLWGVSPGGSQAYEQANAEYQHLLKMAYERLGA